MVKIIYGAEWCAPCKTLKAKLDSEGVEYEYRDVDEKKWSRHLADLGVRSIPYEEEM